MMTDTRATHLAALAQYAAWRADSIPAMTTAHVVHRLTAGTLGSEGDHDTLYPLARAAMMFARRRPPA
jgi:hypothetical protein